MSKSPESLDAEVSSLWKNVDQAANRLRALEKVMDTRNSPWWKRVIFRIDGWGPWYKVNERPAWRPWRRWWTS